MKEIYLTQGKFAIVDDADFEWLNQFKWFANKGKHTFYAVRRVTIGKGLQENEMMHRLILGLTDKNILVDHKDRNGLNNRRDNIRPCTNSQNQMNKKSMANATSPYLGVSAMKQCSTWRAVINPNGKTIHLGCFRNEREAAAAYNQAAIKHFGEFAKLNVL